VQALVVCRHQPGADAPDVDLRALLFEFGDQAFVQVVAGDNLGVREAGCVEHCPRAPAQVGQVA